MPTNLVARAVSHDAWSATLIILMPWYLGAFARRESSPLPWLEFSAANARHGFTDGLFALASVIIVELWIFWIPANSYAINRQETDEGALILLRLLNCAIGLILVTADNPIYNFIGLLRSSN